STYPHIVHRLSRWTQWALSTTEPQESCWLSRRSHPQTLSRPLQIAHSHHLSPLAKPSLQRELRGECLRRVDGSCGSFRLRFSGKRDLLSSFEGKRLELR